MPILRNEKERRESHEAWAKELKAWMFQRLKEGFAVYETYLKKKEREGNDMGKHEGGDGENRKG